MSTLLHRFVITAGIMGGLAVISGRADQTPAQVQQTFRSVTDVVTIQASVRDARGRVVSGLTTPDFEVRDNGQLRPILSLQSDRQSPVSLAILVDMSGSMRIGSKIAMARQAYDSLLSQLRRPG
jgi:Mg-chelatase subunit ChlD